MIGYIKEIGNSLNIIEKMKVSFKLINISKISQGIIFEIPKGINEKRINKICKKLQLKLEKYKINKVIISEKIIKNNLKLYEKIIEELEKANREIIQGEKIMKYMSFDIFKYILKLQNKKINEEGVYFLIKKEENFNIQFLYDFINNCKTVNIVTDDIEGFKKIQENLFEKENILITVSNNKEKALKRAKYIFNVNMDEKELKKYKINREAIIVNLKRNIKYAPNIFNGINVTRILIKIPDEYIEKFEGINKENEFDILNLYEAIFEKQIKKAELEEKNKNKMFKEKTFKKEEIIKDIIKKDKIKIIGLVGNNGKISEKEITKIIRK